MTTCPHGKHIPHHLESFRICNQCEAHARLHTNTLESKIKLIEDAISLMLKMGYDVSELIKAQRHLDHKKNKEP